MVSLQQVAERCAEVLWSRDAASRMLGMVLDSVGPGAAVLSLTVADRHCNGHGTCHGGIIFALADSAFAFACNSRNAVAVAQNNSIAYHRPVHVGDTMRATAREVTLTGRSGLYDVEVRVGAALVASFRGASRVIPGTHFDAGTEDAEREPLDGQTGGTSV